MATADGGRDDSVRLTVDPERSDGDESVLLAADASVGDDPVASVAAYLDAGATHDDVDALVEVLRTELHYLVIEE